jgi:hypothetical protein
MTDETTPPDGTAVADRSPDGGDGRHWFKEFVHRVLPGHRFDPDTMDHTANLAGAVQAAIQAGVHPKGDPWFVGSRPHETAPDNHILTYAVPAVPSIGDTEPETTVTPTQVTLSGQAQTSAEGGRTEIVSATGPEGTAVATGGETSNPVGTAQSHPADDGPEGDEPAPPTLAAPEEQPGIESPAEPGATDAVPPAAEPVQ